MKKTILAVILMLIPPAAHASGNFSLWWGYSYSSLVSVNSEMQNVYDGYDSRTTLDPIDAGITIGLDGAYWYYTWWGIGGRVSYTDIFAGTVQGMISGYQATMWTKGSLFEVLAGAPVLFEFFDGKISIGGGIYAGWGYARYNMTKTYMQDGVSWLDADGHCFVFEVPFRLTYHFSTSFLLDLNVSWKSANAAAIYVKSALDEAAAEYSAGDRLHYGIDFSGVIVGLGFNWRFSSKDWPWYEKKFSLAE